jgi:hypothetical protein
MTPRESPNVNNGLYLMMNIGSSAVASVSAQCNMLIIEGVGVHGHSLWGFFSVQFSLNLRLTHKIKS